MTSEPTHETANNPEEQIKNELTQAKTSTGRRLFQKFALAALGSIPWVGGFISAAASMKTEEGALRMDEIQSRWLMEHGRKIEILKSDMEKIAERLASLGDGITDRIESEEYLGLVRQAFRTWDESDTADKRRYISNLISNAAGSTICSDDVVRLFTDWISSYHESHFLVIRAIYKTPECTRFDIWQNVHGSFPREDSAEADLFKLLIRDLSTGGVIRQKRETNAHGEFIRKRTRKNRGSTLESAFEDTKPYVLTELGMQFVHYTMNEIVPRIG